MIARNLAGARVLLSALLVLAALTAALVAPVLPVSAAASIRLSSSVAAPGDVITATGYGFRPGVTVGVYGHFNVRGGGSLQVSAMGATNGAGQFVTRFTVPGTTLRGTYKITAQDFRGNVASQYLTVRPVVIVQVGGKAATVTVTPGRSFFVRGAGFQGGETVNLSVNFPLYSGNTLTVTTTVGTTGSGAFGDVYMEVPYGTKQGTYTLTAVGQVSHRTGKADVNVVYRPSISPASRSVPPGGTLTVNGTDFVANSQVNISLAVARTDGTAVTLASSATAGPKGGFSKGIALPGNVRLGTYTATAVDTVGGFKATTAFAVGVHPAVSVSPAAVSPGQSTTVSGSGFGVNVPVTVTAAVPLFGGGTQTVVVTAHTGPQGTFAARITVPARAAAGSVTVTAAGPNGRAGATLRVRGITPSLVVSPASGIPGSTFTVKGANFLPGSRVNVEVTFHAANGSTIPVSTLVTANGSGAFSAALRVPANAAGGTYTVTATSATSGRSATARLTVAALAPSVVAVPTVAAPGTALTVNGFGFAAFQTVAVSLGGQPLGSATTNSSGQFSLRATVPAGLATGAYQLSARSAGRRAAINITVNRVVSTHFYFASQYTGSGYHEYLAFLNPTEIRARVTITYELKGGATRSKTVSVNPHSRFTEDVNADVGFHVSGSAVVAADVPIAAERVVYHNSDGAIVPGATSPANTWYFANGNTSKTYREYLAIQNPNSAPIQVAVNLLPTHRRAFTIYKSLPPTSRFTVYVNKYVKHDAVGAIVSSSSPIVVNRSIFAKHGTTSKIGVTAPQRTWYFAAGPRNGAKHWIGVINPFNRWSYITLHAYGPFGNELGTAKGWLKPYARAGYLINKIAGRTDVAVVVTASQPLVVEQMTYLGRNHDASTDTFGVTSAAKSWTFAAVNTSAARGEADGLDLFNPGLVPIPVVVQFMTTSGGVIQRTYVINPLNHQHVDVGSVVPSAELGIVAASNSPFIALNRASFFNGSGSSTSTGIRGT